MTHSVPHVARTTLLAFLPLCLVTARARAGDFNNDGFDDLAVGVPGESTNNVSGGAVAVLYGTSNGLSATVIADQLFHQGSTNVPDTLESGDHFGATSVSGDFNGDGCDDLAVGVPDENLTVGGLTKTDAGCVTVLYGRPNVGLQTTQAGFLPQHLQAAAPESFDRFGFALAAGDFDDDGLDDLAIGVPFENVGTISGAGTVHVFYGSATGLDPASRQIWSQNSTSVLDSAEASDQFGSSLAAADFTGDGSVDLAIGAPAENLVSVDAGLVHVLIGFPGFGLSGTGDTTFAQGVNGVPGAQSQGDFFGLALGALPHATSGLAIGCPLDNDSPLRSGSVFYLPPGLSIANGVFLSQNIIPGFAAPTSADRFGSSLVVSDFGVLNGFNGFLDLAIGAPGATVVNFGNPVASAGVVFAMHGTSTTTFGAVRLFAQGTNGILESLESGDGFGKTMHAGNFGKDPLQDLVVGVPLEDSGLTDTGVSHVIYGNLGQGLRATGNQVWTQDTANVNETSETGDQLGASVDGR